MKLLTGFTSIEISIYFILWFYSLTYAIYHTYQIGHSYFSNNFEDTYNDFSTGWNWLNTKKDNSDPEWKYGLILLKELVPWYLAHSIIAELLRQYAQKHSLKLWYTFIGLSFCMYHLGWKVTIYFLFQPLAGYVVVLCKNKPIIWLCNLVSLIVINYYEWFQLDFAHLDNYQTFITISAIAWVNLRCLNYFLEATTNKQLRKFCTQNILTICAYCFYLPIMFYGPLILFTDFNKVFEQDNSQNLLKRLKRLVLNLFRFSFWLFFTELALHFIYINALSYQSEVISEMNAWSLYGEGYCMGQFFHMKYVVFYGLSTTFAHFEGIPVPNTPKCIGRIHLYSDMWKHFDRGLYLFLLRYIYIPLSGAKKSTSMKVFASFVCFLYVYVWHGIQIFIAVWSLLNFVGIAVETLCHNISQTTVYKNKIMGNMSEHMHRRVVCLLATPLFAMSALSNFYFFAGKEVGDIYIYRFLQDSFSTNCIVLTVLYFGSQVSVQVKIWEDLKTKTSEN